ncbi:hypothetical protein Q3G72_017172 [Acer saccharum]|nr:hypothetical protein Q3G72_017172 [Acer saccharum]
MKKGLFGLLHYLMPKRQIISLHSGYNVGNDGDVAFFFGLSGTRKTTLSTDHKMYLIGDVEHCWSENDGTAKGNVVDLEVMIEIKLRILLSSGHGFKTLSLSSGRGFLVACLLQIFILSGFT